MFGARIYPLGHRHKITPFGEILFGTGYSGYNLASQGGFNPYSHWGWGTAWMGGGGLDVKFKPRWTIRLIEFDYEHTNFDMINASQLWRHRPGKLPRRRWDHLSFWREISGPILAPRNLALRRASATAGALLDRAVRTYRKIPQTADRNLALRKYR